MAEDIKDVDITGLDITVAPLGAGVDVACWTSPCRGAFAVFEFTPITFTELADAVANHAEDVHG